MKQYKYWDTFTPIPPNQCPYQVSTFYTLWNPRNSQDKILKLMVTMTRSKVKSRSHHDIAHLQQPTIGSYQVSTTNTLRFLKYSLDKILHVKVTTARSKVNKGHTMTLHTYNPQPMPLPSVNFLHHNSFWDIAWTRF